MNKYFCTNKKKKTLYNYMYYRPLVRCLEHSPHFLTNQNGDIEIIQSVTLRRSHKIIEIVVGLPSQYVS